MPSAPEMFKKLRLYNKINNNYKKKTVRNVILIDFQENYWHTSEQPIDFVACSKIPCHSGFQVDNVEHLIFPHFFFCFFFGSVTFDLQHVSKMSRSLSLSKSKCKVQTNRVFVESVIFIHYHISTINE